MTNRQQESKQRNWEIFRLRGMWASVSNLSLLPEDDVKKIRETIDNALKRYGAEPEGERRERTTTNDN